MLLASLVWAITLRTPCADRGSDLLDLHAIEAHDMTNVKTRNAQAGEMRDYIVEDYPSYEPARNLFAIKHLIRGTKIQGLPRWDEQRFVEMARLWYPEFAEVDEYATYLNAVFAASTAMMLPASKTDLGPHCFAYALVLAGEFYHRKGSDNLQLTTDTPAEQDEDRTSILLASVHEGIKNDWNAILGKLRTKEETANVSRVSQPAFVGYFEEKEHLGENRAQGEKVAAYRAFLNKAWEAGVYMMPGEPKKEDLGRHCFSYAALLVSEFYFSLAPDLLGMNV